MFSSNFFIRHKSISNSKDCMMRQRFDPFVKRRIQENYRSRSAFKLIEINQKYKIFSHQKFVCDLGCSPGGWSQVAATRSKLVIGIDLQDCEPLKNVEFIVGDVFSEETWARLPYSFDEILSDMAHPFTGSKTADVARVIDLCYAAAGIADAKLVTGGSFVCKYFDGPGVHDLKKDLLTKFSAVASFKPKSSRKDSAENYFICRGKM